MSAHKRRSGGSKAKRKIRQNKVKKAVVHPGLETGRYKPLSEHDIKKIHHTALDVLENIGISDPIPEILNHTLDKGCILGDDNRLKFPRSLVEDLLDMAPKEHLMYAINPKYDYMVSGNKTYLSTSGEPISIFEYASQSFRPTTLVDIYDAARLCDQLEHIHQYGQPFAITEYSQDKFTHDINAAYAALAGTQKGIGLAVDNVEHIDPLINLFDTFLGGEGEFMKRPFAEIGGCPIVSPLRFGKDNAEVMVKMAEMGLYIGVCTAPQAGTTAPASLAGSLVQSFAETLACLCVVNLIKPGSYCDFEMWPFISDLRTGAFTGGSGEQALIMAATAQLCNYYGLVSSVACGMTDSKTMDAQAGYEKAITTTAAMLAGGNNVSSYAGAVGSIMGWSFEGAIIDNDMSGNIQRLVKGIEVNDETLSYDVINDVVYGDGHYLKHPQTINLMESEFLYPDLANRQTTQEWEESGKLTIYDVAHLKLKQMMKDYYPEYIDNKTDDKIRSKFPIRLQKERMQANPNWK
jgi:trimethylamine--corrinoid protein Co-methyltransferase